MQGDTIVAKLTETPIPVMLTAEAPQALHKDERTFFLLRYHDGEVATVAQGTGTTFAWESDVFSTYLIAYADAAPAPSGTPAEAASKATSATPSGKSVNATPKTGDPLLMTGAVLTIAVNAAAAGIVVLFTARRRRQIR